MSTNSRRLKARIDDPIQPEPAAPGKLEPNNATELSVYHDADRKAYMLGVYRVRVEGQWVTHTLTFGIDSSYRAVLAAAPRFNAKALAAWDAKLRPHHEALAQAMRAQDRAALDAIVLANR